MSVRVTRQVRAVRIGPASPAVIRASAVGPPGPPGATTFTGLTDTPGSITANFLVVGNGAGDALVFLDPATISGSPGGSDEQVQFNDGGSFGGIPDLSFDGANIHLLNSPGQVLTAGCPNVATPLIALDDDTDTGFFLTNVSNTAVGFTINGEAVYEASLAGPVVRHSWTGFSAVFSGITDKIETRLSGSGIGFDVNLSEGFNAYVDASRPLDIIGISTDPRLRFIAQSLGGSVGLVGPDIAGTVTFTLPSADGTTGQVLRTNGSGVLSFDTLDFTDLGDTPGSLGSAGDMLVVNSGGTALEFVEAIRETVAVNIDNGSTILPTGVVADTRVFRDLNVVGATLVANASTPIEVVVEKASFANYPTTFTTIATLTLSSALKAVTALAQTLADGDFVRFRISDASSNTAFRIAVMLEVVR